MENLYVSVLYTYINIVVDTWIAHKKSAITQMCYEIDRKLLWSGGKDNQLIVSIIINIYTLLCVYILIITLLCVYMCIGMGTT